MDSRLSMAALEMLALTVLLDQVLSLFFFHSIFAWSALPLAEFIDRARAYIECAGLVDALTEMLDFRLEQPTPAFSSTSALKDSMAVSVPSVAL